MTGKLKSQVSFVLFAQKPVFIHCQLYDIELCSVSSVIKKLDRQGKPEISTLFKKV